MTLSWNWQTICASSEYVFAWFQQIIILHKLDLNMTVESRGFYGKWHTMKGWLSSPHLFSDSRLVLVITFQGIWNALMYTALFLWGNRIILYIEQYMDVWKYEVISSVNRISHSLALLTREISWSTHISAIHVLFSI